MVRWSVEGERQDMVEHVATESEERGDIEHDAEGKRGDIFRGGVRSKNSREVGRGKLIRAWQHDNLKIGDRPRWN